ncbi:unnamed protein product [Arctogadus glacialis]
MKGAHGKPECYQIHCSLSCVQTPFNEVDPDAKESHINEKRSVVACQSSSEGERESVNVPNVPLHVKGQWQASLGGCAFPISRDSLSHISLHTKPESCGIVGHLMVFHIPDYICIPIDQTRAIPNLVHLKSAQCQRLEETPLPIGMQTTAVR